MSKPPDVRAAVAALIAQGFTPPDIAHEVVRELRRQAAPYWIQDSSGNWQQPHVCRECGVQSVLQCPRSVQDDPARPWHSVGGCSSDRQKTITLREWDDMHEPAQVRTAETVKRLRSRAKQQQPPQQAQQGVMAL